MATNHLLTGMILQVGIIQSYCQIMMKGCPSSHFKRFLYLQGGSRADRYKWSEIYNPYQWPKING